MTKEELEKEAREYLAEHSKYSEVFGEFFVAVDTLTAMLDFAEPREKQIQIDAEQIRALQKQNGELTDRVQELEAQIEKMKCCSNCKYWQFQNDAGYYTCIKDGKRNGKNYRSCEFNLEKWEGR